MSLAIGAATGQATVHRPATPAGDAGGRAQGVADGDAATTTGAERKTAAGDTRLDDDARRELRELEARDREVRAHEAAHLAAAGGLALSAASFSFQRGPDGKMYAVGGEVSIDISEGGTPEETIARAERIRAAALAPAEPSAQDMHVAARAARMAAEARAALAAEVRDSYGGRAGAVPGGQIDERA
ncbi:MAG: catalase [Rhodocyclaceae bacterium]|nr:catalase [Rhodocyclaceae bacterium]